MARIELVEGTIGNVIISGNQRVKSSIVIDRFEVLPGSIPTIQLLERRLSSVNSNRTFRVTAGLKPGEKPGTTDLQLDVSGELWYLGGSTSLPAYELSSLSGDTGFYLANQVRYGSEPINEAVGQALGMPFNSGVRAFFDVGAVFDDYLRGEPSSFYADFGVGYDFDLGGHLNGDLSVAWPVDPDMNDNIDVSNPRFLFTVSANF